MVGHDCVGSNIYGAYLDRQEGAGVNNYFILKVRCELKERCPQGKTYLERR